MRADIKSIAVSLVRDETDRLTPADFDRAIDLAVLRYGQSKPRRKVEDVVATGSDVLPLPAAWESDSEVFTAEYPIGETPPVYLDCSIYTAPDGQVIRLGDVVANGAEVRLAFSVAHQVTDLFDTIPAKHREAVGCLAAATLLDELAAAAINDGDSTIMADSTDRRTKSAEYASRARALRTRCDDILTGGAVETSAGGSTPAAGATISWPKRGRLVSMVRRG